MAQQRGPGRYAIFRRRRGGLGWHCVETLNLMAALLCGLVLAGCDLRARFESSPNAAASGPVVAAIDQPPVVTLSGVPAVTDGDTLRFGEIRVRLAAGVDAFEAGQVCAAAGAEVPCGSLATAELRRLVAGRPITCSGDGEADRYRRPIVHCRTAEGLDLGGALVASGWAIVEERYGTEYVHLQAQAKTAERGAWAGTFERPVDWRRARKGGAR